jgi:hypothetical protein
MFVTELDIFLQKFHQLWNSGQTAHLDLDTCAGKAWVGLRVQLGHDPGPPHHPPFQHPRQGDSPSRMRRRARRAANRKQQVKESDQKVDAEAETEPRENVDVTEGKTVENVVAEIAFLEESGVAKTPKRFEETDDESNQEKEIIVVEVVEETTDARQDAKVETEEITLKKVVDEICPDVEYEAEPSLVLKSQYPRDCEKCNKHLRSNTDFRKHVVACVMSRK